MERAPRDCEEKFFDPKRENSMEDEERIEREKKAINSLRFVVDRLNEGERRGLKYAIVGGVALFAWMNDEEYKPLRENNTMRDLDVIILDDPQNIIPEIEKEIEGKKQELPLPVEFNICKAENYQSNIQLRAHFKKNQDGYSLVFRDIEEKIPPELMEREKRALNVSGEVLSMETFKPEVLLHLYLKRVAGLSNMDRSKITSFLKERRSIVGTEKEHQEHKKYKIFHQFANEMRERYPLYTRTIRTYYLIDHVLFNSLLSHKIIPRMIINKIIDL